ATWSIAGDDTSRVTEPAIPAPGDAPAHLQPRRSPRQSVTPSERHAIRASCRQSVTPTRTGSIVRSTPNDPHTPAFICLAIQIRLAVLPSPGLVSASACLVEILAPS